MILLTFCHMISNSVKSAGHQQLARGDINTGSEQSRLVSQINPNWSIMFLIGPNEGLLQGLSLVSVFHTADSLFKNSSVSWFYKRFFFCVIVGGYFGQSVMHGCQPSVII